MTVVFIALFVIGILSGIVIEKPASIECYYLNYCDNYIYRIFSESSGGIFVDRLLSSAFFIVLTIPLALSIFCVPLQGILVFYKGFVVRHGDGDSLFRLSFQRLFGLARRTFAAGAAVFRGIRRFVRPGLRLRL